MIVANAIFNAPIDDLDRARTFIESLCKADRRLLPEQCGETEDAMASCDASDTATILSHWGSSFLWKRRRPFVSGVVFPNVKYNWPHGVAGLSADVLDDPAPTCAKLVEEWAAMLTPALAFLHPLTPPEIARGLVTGVVRSTGTRRNPYFTLLTSFMLQEGLPDLWWQTCFGPPYIELIGRNRLLDTPCHSASEFGDSIVIQLTPRIRDVQIDATAFEQARTRAQEHIGIELFAQSLSRSNPRRVPRFPCG